MTFWNVNKIVHWFSIITILIILVILIISVHFTSNIAFLLLQGERYKHIILSFHYCCLLYIITPTPSTLQLYHCSYPIALQCHLTANILRFSTISSLSFSNITLVVGCMTVEFLVFTKLTLKTKRFVKKESTNLYYYLYYNKSHVQSFEATSGGWEKRLRCTDFELVIFGLIGWRSAACVLEILNR